MSLNAIMERRSIRKYTDEKLTKEQIETILRAGMQAPSAGNARTWDFVVVDDRNLLSEITKVHKYSQMLNEASHGIVVCAVPSREIYPGHWEQDCSAATENMLIAIEDMGLGGVWLGVYPEEERCEGLRKIFNIPNEVIPFGIISVGHPAENKKMDDRYDENKVHYNKW